MKGIFGKKKKDSKSNSNPFASKKVNYGGGTTLGGSKPGKLITVIIMEPGSVGVRVSETWVGVSISFLSLVYIDTFVVR